MKFLHLGDLHIGKIVNDFNMIEDQKYILDQILEMIRERGIDGVLIAGDVYDKAIPSEDAVRVFDDFICKLAKEKVKTFLISGNHDSDERLNFGSTLFRNNEIYITSRFDGTLAKQTVEKDGEKVNVYMLPFVKASQVRHFYPEADIENYEDAVRTVIAHSDLDPAENHVLVAHQFVSGKAGEVELGGSENLAVQNVGTIEKIGYDIFHDFDYVALGHIHSPQKVGREEVRYSGSPLSYSLSEIRREKTVPIVTFGREKGCSLELVPLKPLRKMRELRGPLNKLIDPENVTDPNDYVFVTLTDEDPISNALNIIREYYPRIMKLSYDNAHSREIADVDLKDITGGKSFTDLISEFYEKMYHCEISEDELAIILDVAKEAGVTNEAD